jgi:hypothetical protein
LTPTPALRSERGAQAHQTITRPQPRLTGETVGTFTTQELEELRFLGAGRLEALGAFEHGDVTRAAARRTA